MRKRYFSFALFLLMLTAAFFVTDRCSAAVDLSGDGSPLQVVVTQTGELDETITCDTGSDVFNKYFAVYYNSKKLAYGTDYTMRITKYCGYGYGGHHYVWTLRVTGKGDYEGTCEKTVSNLLPTENLEAEPKSSSIKLTWTEQQGAYGYIIYRKKGSGKYKKLTTIKNASTVSWNDTTASGATTKYKYYVVAYSYDSEGAMIKAGKSSVVTSMLMKSPEVAVTSVSSGLKLTWTKSSRASGYYVYRSESPGGGFRKVATLKGKSKVAWVDKKASAGVTYYYRVYAYRGSVKSLDVAATGGCYMGRPTSVSAVKKASGKMKVTFKDSKNSYAQYEIQISTSSSFKESATKTYTVGGRSKTISGLTAGKKYYVRVRAVGTAFINYLSGTGYGTAKVYSAWSAVKSLKV